MENTIISSRRVLKGQYNRVGDTVADGYEYFTQGAQSMVSTLAWLDHDLKARARMHRILSFFCEKEGRDELGLGPIRDRLADQLFPGTSTIQTRLRYIFFIPWIYRSLEDKRVPAASFAKKAEAMERALVEPLMKTDDQLGIFGKSSGNMLKRLPSSVYWAGLGTWGIRCVPWSQDEYHRRIGELYRRQDDQKKQKQTARERGDDIDLEMGLPVFFWHLHLPSPPQDFPAKASFALTHAEAEFILARMEKTCANSLLSYLATHCTPTDTDFPWEHPDYGSFSNAHKELLTHARLFSEVMHGAALSYNIQLARLRNSEELVAEHEDRFGNWLKHLPLEDIRTWHLPRLWELCPEIHPKTRDFVRQWIDFVKRSPKTILSNQDALRLIRKREERKGTRSRFKNQRALEQWSGYSGIRRLNYRWSVVKVLVNDLYLGIQEGN